MQPTAGRTEPPDPSDARTVEDLTGRLRALRVWAGVGHRELHRRVVALRRRRRVVELPAYNTVYRCLQPRRSRLDVELVVDIAAALLVDDAVVEPWRQACEVVMGRAADASIVAVTDAVGTAARDFVGRAAEIDRLVAAVEGGATRLVVEGMPGVGKTRLVHHVAGLLLAGGAGADLTLGVDLRGFDPRRAPADPAAVLDGFLRRLGVPGSEVHAADLAGRARRFRALVEGRKVLLVLDDAADEEVAPLLPRSPTCVTLVTSRRRLSGLRDAVRLQLGPSRRRSRSSCCAARRRTRCRRTTTAPPSSPC